MLLFTMDGNFKLHIPAIQALCKQHHISKLWVYGSVLGEHYQATSDIDFLYLMEDRDLDDAAYYHAFWGFSDALQHLLKRKIDLTWQDGIQNPFFLAEVNETEVLLYEQKAEKVPV